METIINNTNENKTKIVKRLMEITTQQKYLKQDKIEKVLKEKKKDIEQYAYILHDKDVYTKDEEIKNNLHKEGTIKPAHYHIELKLKYPRRMSDVASWFGVPSNFIQSSKSGRYEDMLVYLIHGNDDTKHQYAVSEVVSNFEYETTINKYRQNKKKLTKKKENEDLKEEYEEAIKKIRQREINEYNYYKHISDECYINYKSRFDIAFLIARNKKEDEYNTEGRNMEVIYIQGESESGKTTYAKLIAKQHNMDFFPSSSSNDPLYGYRGQNCIILDDLREEDMKFTDLLKFLDNNTSSTVVSRYHNKLITADLIIITSVKTIDELYELYGKFNEPLTQIKRRCGTYIQMTKEKIKLYSYDSGKSDYEIQTITKNPMLEYISTIKKEDEETHKARRDFLGFEKTPDEEYIQLYAEKHQLKVSEVEEMFRENPDTIKNAVSHF